MGVLYKLTAPTGKCYIGITSKTLEARWAKHVEHALGKRTNGALYAALRKYGPDTFTREVLRHCEDWDQLCQLEQETISALRTQTPHGYNISLGGEGVLGPRDESTRAKVSVAQRKRYTDPEQLARLREYGRRGREAKSAAAMVRREAKAVAHRAYVATGEPRRKHSAAVKAALARPDVKAKMVAAFRRRDPAWIEKMRLAKTGMKVKPCSESRKQKIAEARRREWADPVIRATRLAGLAKARAAKAAGVTT